MKRNEATNLGGNENLDSTMLEQPLHNALVLLVQGFVVVTDTMLQRLLQTGVTDVLEMWRQIRLLNMQEARCIVIGTTMSEDVVGRESALTTRRNEHDNRLVGRVFEDGKVGRFRHGYHERGEVGDLEALDVDVHVEWASTVDMCERDSDLGHLWYQLTWEGN